MYLLDEKYEKYKTQHTPVFKECLDLIKEDYDAAKTHLDCLSFMNREEITISIYIEREKLEKKISAYESLFPFFCS